MYRPGLRRALSIAVLVLAGVGAVAVWVATDVTTRLSAATEVAADSADVLDRSIDTADAIVESIRSGLDGADLVVADISSSTELAAGVIEEASDLLKNDVADSVAAIEGALPGIVEAGTVIDNTLSALEFFGVSYDTDVPFSVALAEVRDSVSGLAEELREQGDGLGEIAAPVRDAGTETAALASVLGDVQTSLADARTQLADYRASTVGLRDLAGTATVDVGLLSTLGRVFAALLAFVGLLGAALAWPDPATYGSPGPHAGKS